MKKLFTKKGIFSLLLAGAMVFSQASMVFAEGETTEETDTITYTLAPDNYASIYLQKGDAKTEAGGYNGTARTMNMYYNTLYSENAYIYMHSGSILSEYTVPLKIAVSEMGITHSVGTFPSNAKNNGSHPIFYNIGAFSAGLNIEKGTYAGPATYGGTDGTAQYEAIKAITANYWPVSATTSVGYTNTAWASQVAASFKGTSETTGSRTKDVAEAAVTAFKADTTTDVITFATGRSTSGYAKAAYSLDAETEIPSLTLTYSKSALTTEVNDTTDAAATLADLNTIGALADTTKGYDGYTALTADEKAYVNGVIADATYTDWASFCTAYDALIENPSAPVTEASAVLTKDYADTTLSDGETGASIWTAEITEASASYKTATAVVTDKTGKTAEATDTLPTITGGATVSFVVTVNRMASLIESVMLSVE